MVNCYNYFRSIFKLALKKPQQIFSFFAFKLLYGVDFNKPKTRNGYVLVILKPFRDRGENQRPKYSYF